MFCRVTKKYYVGDLTRLPAQYYPPLRKYWRETIVKKTRSPNYPRMSLRDAIEQVARVYEEEGRQPALDEDIAEDLGYNTLNGTSRGLLSALKKYGLLQRDGDRFKVSDDAVAIIELPTADIEYAAAVRRVAFRPTLFVELYEKYGDDLPDDKNLRHLLITKGFNPKTTNEVIRVYRDTLEFVSEETADYAEVEDEDRPEMKPPVQPVRKQTTEEVQTAGSDPVGPTLIGGSIGIQQSTPAPVTVLQLRTSETSEARIELIGDVTQESIEALVSILNVQKLVFPKQKEPK
jgi:hypothetical protein